MIAADRNTASASSGTDNPVVTVLTAPGLPRSPAFDRLDGRATVRWTEADGLTEALPGTDVLLLWDFLSDAVAGSWSAADDLRWIHVAAAGVDKLLFDDLAASDVVVTNARGVFDRPIAEFVLGSILAFGKDFITSLDNQRAGTWKHRESLLVKGRTALVVGTGGIGREIARLLTAAGLQVQGVGRTARDSDPDFGRVLPSSELAAHAGWADHLVLVAPLTEATRNLVDADVLAAMKPTAQLVNVGRGQLVDQPALVTGLQNGDLAGAALDVFATEPLPADDPLWALPQVQVTPHMSGDVIGWRDTLAEQFVDNFERWQRGEALLNQVDKRLGYVPSGAATDGADRS